MNASTSILTQGPASGEDIERYEVVDGVRVERGSATMVSFKGAHFVKDIILTCVRWYVASRAAKSSTSM